MKLTYKVKLETFEGPLDLLLHLVNELEIDIYDIPVAKITEQYMKYIKAMEQIELNIASEYLVMAATLIEIKSAMLLPKKEVNAEDEYEEDPREQLVNRLIEYKKYKEVAETLQEKELEENQIFTRTPVQFDDLSLKQPVVRGDISVFDMLDALDYVFERQQWMRPLDTTVNVMEVSIEERMEQILHEIKDQKTKVAFAELFPYPNKLHIVTTFLALLQLLKNNELDCKQAGPFKTIYLLPLGDE